MVSSPRMRDELREWNKYLSECEEMVSRATNEIEVEIHTSLANYASQKILDLEKEMYEGA